MNMETINIPLINGRINVRRIFGVVADALHSAGRRITAPSGNDRTKIARAARLEKERHQAQSIAQVLSVRYFR